MNIFFGTYFHSLDEKSRCTLPAKFRDKLGKVVYVTKGFDHCLYLYTEESFMEIAERNSQLSELSLEERQFQRTFFGSSAEYELDKAGRITLSKDHLQRAGISKDVVLVGNFDHIEIWSRDRYEEVNAGENDNYETNAKFIAASKKGE